MTRRSSTPLAFLLLGACAGGPGPEQAGGQEALARDVAAYAVASCLARLDEPFLREQGVLWAGAVVQRGHGPVEPLIALAEAVEAELARTGVAQGKPDGPGAPTKPMPLMTCGEIVHRPAVRAATARTAAALRPSYGWR